ncbi:MAG: hydantoinase/oxoprolinase family protein, partial [Proteobacteria bacterium]|nr:hydantoinase/oxoprolinase family protein [Pseudomonadota bacterium]
REAAIESASAEARQKAIEAGASPDSIEIVELDELPLTYMPGGAVRLRAKAVGDLVQAKG